MSEKRSKYDTDPLDPEFVRRTEELMSQTREVEREPQAEPGPHGEPALEEPTRRFDEQYADSYPSMFVPPAYQPPAQRQGYTNFGPEARRPQPDANTPPTPASQYVAPTPLSSRPVQKLGLAEKWACILPYAPFYIGLVAALVELFIVPRTETRTRFHAAQGLALQLVIIAGSLAFNLVGVITDSSFGGWLFGTAAFIFLIVSMFRVGSGQPHHLAPLDDATRWLNEKIESKK